MKRKWIAVLWALALFAVLAGCGKKSDDTSVQGAEETPQATEEPAQMPLDLADDTSDALTDDQIDQVIAALTDGADTAESTDTTGDTTSQSAAAYAGNTDMDVWVDQSQTVTEGDPADDGYYEDIEDIFEDIGPIELPMDYVD
jgi:hypothetical protein